MNKDKVQELADRVEHSTDFNMCDPFCCIGAHTKICQNDRQIHIMTGIREELEISTTRADQIAYPWCTQFMAGDRSPWQATGWEAAIMLRRFAETEIVDWSDI